MNNTPSSTSSRPLLFMRFFTWLLLATCNGPAFYKATTLVRVGGTAPYHPGPAVLGSDELASPHAETRHIEVSKTAEGNWQLYNRSSAKKVELKRQGSERRVRDWLLSPGGGFMVNGERFTVETVTDNRLDLIQHHPGGQVQAWHYDGRELMRGTDLTPPCPDSDWWRNLRIRRRLPWVCRCSLPSHSLSVVRSTAATASG